MRIKVGLAACVVMIGTVANAQPHSGFKLSEVEFNKLSDQFRATGSDIMQSYHSSVVRSPTSQESTCYNEVARQLSYIDNIRMTGSVVSTLAHEMKDPDDLRVVKKLAVVQLESSQNVVGSVRKTLARISNSGCNQYPEYSSKTGKLSMIVDRLGDALATLQALVQ